MFKKSSSFYFINKKSIILSQKKVKAKTDFKNIVVEEYHNFLNIFLEKNLNTLLFIKSMTIKFN